MKLTRVLTLMLVMCFFASTAMASPDNNVRVAPNGKGDVLIYPLFFNADGGIETKLTVVNTAQDRSTVAKLVVRSHRYSKELLNFFIYLSPADVWEGTLKYDAEKGYVMYSENNSAQARTNVWASSDDPMNQPLSDLELRKGEHYAEDYGDSKVFGYVYVVNAATSSGDVDEITIGDTTRNINNPETPKPFVKKWFDELASDDVYPDNVLSGWMDFNIEGAYTSRLNATVLADYRVTVKPTLGMDTVFGIDAENTLAEVEAALAKDNIVMPYQATATDASIHFFTFPTKYSYLRDDGGTPLVRPGGNTIRGMDIDYPVSPFFYQNASNMQVQEARDIKDLCVEYTPSVYNQEEEKMDDPEKIFSPFRPETGYMCDEVYFWGAYLSDFEAGVTHYDFGNARTEVDGYSFQGAPVIPFVMEVGAQGLSMAYGSWDDGKVTDAEDVEIPFYQYTGTLVP